VTGVDTASLLLRGAAGLTFVFSGLQKLVPGAGATVDFFDDLGLPWPEVSTQLIGGLEFFGGLALLFGAATRIAGALFVVEMIGALLVARLPQAAAALSVADAVEAVRLELLLIAACASLVVLGPGRVSIDAMARRWSLQRAGAHL